MFMPYSGIHQPIPGPRKGVGTMGYYRGSAVVYSQSFRRLAAPCPLTKNFSACTPLAGTLRNRCAPATAGLVVRECPAVTEKSNAQLLCNCLIDYCHRSILLKLSLS